MDGTLSTPEDLAEIIEETIFDKFGRQTSTKYKTQIRSRVFNLKDKKNPELRQNVLCGVIKPEKLALMTSEEMASEEVRFDSFPVRPVSLGFWGQITASNSRMKHHNFSY